MQSDTRLQFFLSALAGALLPFAYAPYGGYLLAFIAPAILFYIWHTCTPRQAFYTGYLFGVCLFGIGIGWLHISIHRFGGINLSGAYAITFVLVALLGFYPATIGLLSRLLVNRINALHYLLVLPALWTVIEWCRGWFFTGFPWLNLGASQTDSLLAAWAPVLGVYGVSLLVCVGAGCVVLLCLKRNALLACAVLIAVFTGSVLFHQINWTKADSAALSAVLVQGAIPQTLKWNPAMREKTYQHYLQLTEPYRGSDFIVWPETAIPAFVDETETLLDTIKQSLDESGAVFLTGIPSRNQAGTRYYNSILLLDDNYALYHKRHLVPFGEYFPFRTLLGAILGGLDIPMSNFSPGDSDAARFTSKGVLGLSICYENAFGNEIRMALPAAEILVNVSNDAWFGDSIALHQHLQIARMRAIETERFMLRSTNTGLSAVINHKGNIIAQSPPFEPHALTARVHRRHGATPFILFGYWPILVFCFSILVVNYVQIRKQNRSPTA